MLNGGKSGIMSIPLSHHKFTCNDQYYIHTSIFQSVSCQKDLGTISQWIGMIYLGPAITIRFVLKHTDR